MITKTAIGLNYRFKIGWFILIIFDALMALNHIALSFSREDFTLAIGYAAFNLYALLVILIPFRKIERWAWLVTWILPVGLVLPALGTSNPLLILIYSTVSAVCVVGVAAHHARFLSQCLENLIIISF